MSSHSKKEILVRLKKQTIGVLGTRGENDEVIRLRIMYFGIDNKFNCFMMSSRESPKIDQIQLYPHISLLVFGIEDPYDRSWEIELSGKVVFLSEKKDLDYALERLKNRNPFADVAYESGITDYFVLMKLIPKMIRFSLYFEVLQGAPPTILTV